MSTDTRTSTVTDVEPISWGGGVVAGLAGGIVFGLMLTAMMPSIIGRAIPAMFGLSGVVAGWAVHLGWSVVFGVGFAAITEALDWGDDLGRSAGLGIAYGFGLWLVNIVFVWPVWLQAVGFPKAPALPNVALMPLVGHLMYGVVAGAVYPYVNDV